MDMRHNYWLWVLPLLAWCWCSVAAGAAPRHIEPPVQLVRVPLPVTGEADRRVQRSVGQLLDAWEKRAAEPSPAETGDSRPILVLEFGGDDQAGGRDSQFEQALSLARFLSSSRLARVRTVAWLTGPVQGHAVLPVLACEQIIASPEAELGRAGIGESHIDGAIRGAYEDVAERRRTIPVPVVLGMLDAALVVYRVDTLDGKRYALEQDLEALKQEAVPTAVERIVPAGELANLSGGQLRLEFGFASHMARDRAELASALGIPVTRIQQDPTLGTQRRPLRADLLGPIHTDNINWVERSLRDQIEQQQVNLVCVVVDSPGGSATDSLRLASFLAGLDSSRVRTVAFVPSEARSDAALIALACDELVLGEQAVLGGPGRQRIGRRQLEDLAAGVRQIAQEKHRSWSPLMAMIDQQLEIRRYAHQEGGAVRYFSAEELAEQPDAGQWKAEGRLPTGEGLRTPEAVAAGLAAGTAEDFAAFQAAYQLEGDLPTVRPNWAHRVIEFLAMPQVAGALLFIGWFALMFEFMSPGVGLGGFLAALCFLLFFWSSVLHGTAGWLEILLFVAGVICVALELLVLPGFGAFGIGGGLLIVASIILASQTFVFPRNAYEWSQLPDSLLVVSAAGAGIIAALACMRRVLTQAPVFRRVALEQPDEQQLEQIRYQESLVHLDYLHGKRGVTVTRLAPSGKVRFGDEVVDVLSDGELILPGTDVAVTEVRGSEVVVRALG